MKIKHLLILLTGMLLLASCVTSRRVNYMQEPDRRIPSYDDTLSYVDYHLLKGDRLYIHVYSINDKINKLFNQNNTTNMQHYARSASGGTLDLYTYMVDDDGNINFPTVGKLYVRGLTTREVKHLLEDKLSGLSVHLDGGMLDLSVEVQVVQRYYSVLSAPKSGRYPINKEKMTIFEAIAQAGDIADFGDRSKLHIIRENEDSTIVKTFDVRSADIINSEFYYIEPNDVIYIQLIKGQAFGLNSAATVVSVTASTLSFGVFIYTLVDRFIVRPIQRNKEKNASTGGSNPSTGG